jgi:hypothetical protein
LRLVMRVGLAEQLDGEADRDAQLPEQPVALVLEVDRHLGQRLGVLAAVVRAVEQLPASREQNAGIRLGAATIADV